MRFLLSVCFCLWFISARNTHPLQRLGASGYVASAHCCSQWVWYCSFCCLSATSTSKILILMYIIIPEIMLNISARLSSLLFLILVFLPLCTATGCSGKLWGMLSAMVFA